MRARVPDGREGEGEGERPCAKRSGTTTRSNVGRRVVVVGVVVVGVVVVVVGRERGGLID